MEEESTAIQDLVPTELLADLVAVVATVGGSIILVAATWAGVKLIKRLTDRV